MSSTPTRRPAHLSRGALVVPAIMAALGLFLIVGTTTMDIVGDGGLFGPTSMPWAVAVLALVVAALLTVDILRPRPEYDSPAAEEAAGNADATGADNTADNAAAVATSEDSPESTDASPEGINVTAVLISVAGVVGFIVVLQWLGWILSATGLFVAVAAALGNRNWLTMGLAGLALASTVQIAFSMLLGIALPSGFVGGF